MIKNYFKIAWRNIWKNKVFSFINILGLALGLTCSTIILLWISDEYKVDAFHKKIDRLFVVTSQEFMEGEILGGYDTPGLLGQELPKVLPDVEMSCSFAWPQYLSLKVGEKNLKLQGNFAGPDFFKMFSYPLIEGSVETALNDPDNIAISNKTAVKFFGSPEAAIGKTIRFENYRDLNVSAVFQEQSKYSSEHFEYILTWELYKERNSWIEDWHNSGPRTFVLVKRDANPENLKTNIREFIKGYDKEYKINDRLELGLQNYGQKYLNSNFKDGIIAGGRIDSVKLFGFVALFILIIACINFMNLSTARSLKRAKEIGVRKVIGAERFSLIKQFMGEALIYAGIAGVCSLLLLVILLPSFNNFTAKQISLPFNDPIFWIEIVGLILTTGLISGSYPAFLLSSFKPISILKTGLKLNPASAWLRKGLVIFQFALCIIFIVSMTVISKQVNYVQNKNLGYEKNNLMYLNITGTMAKNYDFFKSEVLKIPGVTSMTKMSQRPIELENTTGGVEWEGKAPNTFPRFTQTAIGYDFIKTMEADLISGRDFSKDFADSSNFMVNEAALKIIGYKEPIGKPLSMWGVSGTIVGVVKDFHFNTLHKPIEPLIMRMTNKESYGYTLIRIEKNKTQEILDQLEKLHLKLNPDFIFAIQFADAEYAASYTSESTLKRLSACFTFLAILISCLGLLGLVLFSAEQRAKEISIRKILGASVASLFTLLSKEFLLLIFIAFLIATPVAWLAMMGWLENYTYKIQLDWEVFLFAGFSSFAIALLTISYQTGKSALANPVKSLRTD